MSERRNNRHHVLHEEWTWNANKWAHDLRVTPSLVVTMPTEIHRELHAACPHVPILGSYALQAVNRLFVPSHNRDTLKDMDSLQVAIDKASKSPRAHMLERDLAGLAIEAIDLQKPFIREGIIRA